MQHGIGYYPVGEKENGPFQFTFNGLPKVAFQGSRVTSDAGLILVRELDERLGLEQLITDHVSDSRHGTNTQFRAADLLRQSVYICWRSSARSQARTIGNRSPFPP